MTYRPPEHKFGFDLRTVKECSTALNKIDEMFISFSKGLYLPREDAADYEPEIPGDVTKADIVVHGITRKRKRGGLNTYLSNISQEIKGPWKMHYDPSQKELKLVFYSHVAEEIWTLYVEFEPRIIEHRYFSKGYSELVKNRKNVKSNISKKGRELAFLVLDNSRKSFFSRNRQISKLQKDIEKELGCKISSYIGDIKGRIKKILLKKPEYLKRLPRSEEIEKWQQDLKDVEGKISGMQGIKRKVLKHDSTSPRITVIPNYKFRVVKVSGERVYCYSPNERLSEEEKKEKKIAEVLERYIPFLDSSVLTEESKLEVTQNLESLAMWLKEEIPLIPQ